MRGHDDLAVADLFHAPHQFQKFHLASGRQRGFRFVEDEDALALAALFEEAQKAFAVGVREKIGWRTASDAGNFFEVDRVQVSRNGKETLGPKKPAIGDFRQPARTKCRRQPSTHLLQRIRMIDWFVTLGTAGLVIAGEHGDAFSSVDLPVPFSPTMMVIARSKLSSKS